jgi:hypothetical protein|nr:MAG TPA: hypothetical protein [Caudoviricetes sp.]
MTSSQDPVLLTTPVFVPTAVLHDSTVPASKYVTASNNLPIGWHAVLLNLWPHTLEGVNRSLIATKAKPCPNPSAKRSDGELLRSLRRRVHGWLNATDVPVGVAKDVAADRAKSYAEASAFATGSADAWGRVIAAGTTKPRPASPGVQDAVRRSHKKHAPRQDVYHVLRTDRGHTVLFKASSTVGRAIDRDKPAIPDGWTLTRVAGRGDGVKGSATTKILRAKADYDRDRNVPLAKRLAIESLVMWIKAASRQTNGA